MDHQEWLDQHDRMIADHDLRMEKFDFEMEKLRTYQEKTDQTLRRAIRLSVLDARRQRQRNAEFGEKMTQLASALTAFLERGGTGSNWK